MTVDLLKNSLAFGQKFCVYPFVHYHLDTHKNRLPCCAAKKVNHSDQDINVVKQKMLANQQVDGCENCYFKEANQQISMRQEANKFVLQNWPQVAENITDKIDQPIWYDLRFSNLCNLECQTCHWQNSSKIAEAQGLDTTHLKWEPDIEINPMVKRIYLAGGEPFLIKRFSSLLNSVVNTDAMIEVNTNATILTDHLMNALDRFSNVHFILSIDAYGQLNDIIRKNSNWDVINQNLKLLQTRYPNATFSVNTVIQKHNVNQLLDLARWINENNFSQWTMTTLTVPMHLHHTNVEQINIPEEIFAVPIVKKSLSNIMILKSIKSLQK